MFDFILSSILKSTVVLFILTGCLGHNYLKLNQEGHLKQQISEEVGYSNALWRRDYDGSWRLTRIYQKYFAQKRRCRCTVSEKHWAELLLIPIRELMLKLLGQCLSR